MSLKQNSFSSTAVGLGEPEVRVVSKQEDDQTSPQLFEGLKKIKLNLGNFLELWGSVD